MRLKLASSIGSALRVAFMGVIRASSYYAIVDGPTWTQADANAVAIGGHLAALSSEGEHLWLAQEFSKPEYYYDGDSNSGDPESWTHFWLGGKKESGAWSWTNSEPWLDGWEHDWGLPNNPTSGVHNYLMGIWNVQAGHNQWIKHGNGIGTYYWDDSLNTSNSTKGIAEIPLSYFSISDASFREGKGGEITITRTGGTTTSQTLRVKSSDGTATTSDNDYTAINTTVSFATGETSKTISISTTADLDVEDDETFNLTITAEGTDDVPPQISDGSAKVTIKADDFKRGDSLYTIVDGPSWSQAENEANRLGGNLTTIENEDENNYLVSVFKNLEQEPVTSPLTAGIGNWARLYYIGLKKKANNAIEWIDGSDKSYRNWGTNGSWTSGGRNIGIISLDNSFAPWMRAGKWALNVENEVAKLQGVDAIQGIAEIPLTPSPTYSLSTSTTSIDEASNSSVRTTISTKGVDADTRLYYTVSGSGINSSDFSTGDIKGSRLIKSDGTATFLHTAAADKTTEGSESFTIKLYTDWARTNLVATSDLISISDTSKTPAKPSYSLSLSPSAVDEGDSFRASIATKNVKAGTKLFYAIKGGVDADDFSGKAGLTGRVSIDGSGNATFTRKTTADKLTEGSETARVLLYSDRQRTVQVGDAASVTIRDTSKTPAKPSYSIGFSSSSVKEGDILNSTIATKNVDPGTRLYWSLTGSGINGSDFSSGSLKGSSAIDKSGEFSITHALAADKTTEGNESLKLQLFSDAKRQTLLTQESVTIRDTSKQAQTANLTGATVNGNLLTLSFDASLANTTPNAARFSVKAAGSAIAVRSTKVKANAGTL